MSPFGGDFEERLFAFLDRLRKDGFRVGIGEQVAVGRVLGELRLERRIDDVAELAGWIAPIVCGSADDQRSFRTRFERWCVEQRPAEHVVTRAPIAERDVARNWARWMLAGAALSVLVGVALFAWGQSRYRSPVASRPTPSVADEPSTRPEREQLQEERDPAGSLLVTGWTRAWNPLVLHGEGVVNWVSFNPDGTRVVTARGGGDAQIFDARSGAALAALRGHEANLHYAEFNPDGTRVVTASDDGTARIFDVTSGAERVSLRGHQSSVLHAEFSRDGTRVVTASSDGTARIFDADSGAVLAVLEALDSWVYHSEFSPTGKRVLTANSDGTARIFDGGTGAEINLFRDEERYVTHAEFNWNGTRVVISGSRGARVYDADTALPLAVLQRYGPVNHARFNPDGTHVVTASSDGTVRIFDATRGAELADLRGHEEEQGEANDAVFSLDGTRVVTASSDGTSRIFDAASGAELATLHRHERDVTHAEFSPDGTRVATACDDGTARVFDTSSGAFPEGIDPLGELRGHTGPVHTVAFSPDGQHVLSASADSSARLWLVDGTEDPLVLRHADAVQSASFSPDGTLVVTVSSEAGVWTISDPVAAKPLSNLTGQTLLAAVLAEFSPGTNQVVTGSKEGLVRRDTFDGKFETTSLADVRASIRSVAISPNAQLVAAGVTDGTTHLVSPFAGGSLHVLRGHEDVVVSVSFSPDGAHLVTASADRTARVWRTDGSGEAEILRGHESSVTSAVFSRDGARVLTASSDGTALLWQREGGRWVPGAVVAQYAGPLNSAAFDPSNGRVVTGGEDGVVRLWGVPPLERERFPWAMAGLVALGMLATPALGRRAFGRLALRRGRTTPETRFARLGLATSPPEALRGADLRAQAIRLRRRTTVPSDELDVERSIERTLHAGGFVQRVWRARLKTPEYLALIERVAPRDHLARQADQRLNRLESEGVRIERASFVGDPGAVFLTGLHGHIAALGEVSTRFPAHRLWVFSDRGSMGVSESWIEDIAAWEHRSLLVPDVHDTTLPDALSRGGVAVAPGSDPTATLEEPGESLAVLPSRFSVPFPPSIARDPERWMSTAWPDPRRVGAMLADLRSYLGEACFRWCAACAVYPELRYELTLDLGRLIVGEELGEGEVTRLVRLPWFRRGWMPDWLRMELLDQLPPEMERAVRERFLRLFSSGAAASQLDLPIAVDAYGPMRATWLALPRDDPDAPAVLRDAVFLDWMGDRLSVRVRRSLKRALRREAGSAARLSRPVPRPTWLARPASFVAGGMLTSIWQGSGVTAGIPASLGPLAAYAVLLAGAHASRDSAPSGKGRARLRLSVEVALLLAGGLVAGSQAHAAFRPVPALEEVGAFLAPMALAWVVFEWLKRRSRGAVILGRLANRMLLDRLVAWLFQDLSAGRPPAATSGPRPRIGMVTTPAVAALIATAAWTWERREGPNEWVWATAGLLLAVWLGASVLATSCSEQPRSAARSELEVLFAWIAVLVVSSILAPQGIAWLPGLLIGVWLFDAAFLGVEWIASLRERRHPLYDVIAPLGAVAELMTLGWLQKLARPRSVEHGGGEEARA